MPKEKSPPVNLDKYLEGRNHKYMTYEKASRLYGLPYWGFVSVAKEAKATWKLRKTAIVDIVVFEKYLEEHCAISEDEDVINEMEDYIMPRTRKEVENLEELVKSKKKKYSIFLRCFGFYMGYSPVLQYRCLSLLLLDTVQTRICIRLWQFVLV